MSTTPTPDRTKDATPQDTDDRPKGLTSLYLDVEVNAGSDIYPACRDACALADRMGITIWFKFNGKKLHANPGTDVHRLIAGWHQAIADKREYVRPV